MNKEILTQNAKNTNVHTVVGTWDGTTQRVTLYQQPYYVTHLHVGAVIEFNDHYYRVYNEDGNRGLRLWNVDVEVSREQIRYIEVITLEVA